MSEFRTIRGFEDVWRPPVRPSTRKPEQRLVRPSQNAVRDRLQRIVRRAPEVMVKVTGRTRDAAHLAAHLTYITRNGDLPAEDRDGQALAGQRAVLDLARDWSAAAMLDSARRANSPLSIGLILSMPAGTDAIRLRDAARAFAGDQFAERFEYVLVLHTDTAHPHVHLSLRAFGDSGERLNPKKADLELWRQRFAQALRDQGVEAEATPRRTRGVTRKPERTAVRKIRERFQLGGGPAGSVARGALRQAAQIAFGGPIESTEWERASVRRQERVRGLYLAQARVLRASLDDRDRALGRAVEAFVAAMPRPDSQRLALARQLRAANERLIADDASRAPVEHRDRTR